MDDQLRKKLAAKHQRCAFPTNPQEDKKGITIFDYAVVRIAAGMWSNPTAGEYTFAEIARDAVDQALAVFKAIEEEGF